MTSSSEQNSFPKLILLSDHVPSRNIGGISQTLYNIFCNYPEGRITCLADLEEKLDKTENLLKSNILRVRINPIPYKKNRIGGIINSYLRKMNSFIRDVFPHKVKSDLFIDSILFISTTSLDRLHFGLMLKEKLKLPMVIYYMDDWMKDQNTNWLVGNLQQLVKVSLQQAIGRLYISDNLKTELEKRYALTDQSSLIIHNPVDIPERLTLSSANSKKAPFKIIYAGSIWPMHYDALLLTAQAVQLNNIQSSQKISLEIYSKNHFWKKYEAELAPLGVSYKGFITYDEVQSVLKKGWLLLVCSSLKEEYEAYSASSVQTKITDYMISGVPILSVGPVYGACNEFLLKWECGYTFEQMNAEKLSTFLGEVANDETKKDMAERAFHVAKNNFSKPVVQRKVYDFLEAVNF